MVEMLAALRAAAWAECTSSFVSLKKEGANWLPLFAFWPRRVLQLRVWAGTAVIVRTAIQTSGTSFAFTASSRIDLNDEEAAKCEQS